MPYNRGKSRIIAFGKIRLQSESINMCNIEFNIMCSLAMTLHDSIFTSKEQIKIIQLQ